MVKAKTIKLTRTEKQYLILILLLSFIIKLVLAFAISTELRSDSMVYDALAKSIVEKGEYSFEGKPTALLISGYPIFLSAIYKFIGTNQLHVKIIQSLLEIFTCLFFYLVCRKFLNTKYSLIAAAVFAFFPSNILYSQTVLTEPLFGLLGIIILYLCLDEKFSRNALLLGIVWGLAIMVRSSFALSVVLIPLYLFIYHRQLFDGYGKKRLLKALKYSALFAFMIAVVLLPWLIRNKITIGSYTLATQGGFTFWSGSNPEATGTWYYNIENTNPLFNEQDEVKRDKEFYKLGLDYAVHNPHKFLITGIKKLGYLFSSERMILLYFTEDEGKTRTSTEVYKSINPLLIVLVNLSYFAVMLMGIWGILLLKKHSFFIYGFVLTWMATIFIFVALSRYHYVLIPFFIIGAVYLLSVRLRSIKSLNLTQKIIGAGFTIFFLGIWASEFYLLLK